MPLHLCSYQTRAAVFSPDECARIVEIAESLDLKDAKISNVGGDSKVDFVGRNCAIQWVERKKAPDWEWVFARITEHAQELNEKLWKFDVRESRAIQYTSYGFGQFYARHFDNGSTDTAHRKLSVTVQLTPPGDYWGGNLKLWSMNDSDVAPREQGTMTVFPSYLMHVAKPVLRGTRRVLVSWLDGQAPLR